MARVYVIDDDDELLMMVGLILKKAGHQATLLNDSTIGMERVIEEKPDLLILDLMMPHVSGFDVCERIRAHPDVKQIPIMILTARLQPGDREAALEAGANAYVTKPITSRQLITRVNRLLEEHHHPAD